MTNNKNGLGYSSPTTPTVYLGLQKVYGVKNPFSFMDLKDVQELANFFERRVSAYQVAVAGDVSFNEAF